MDGYRKTWFVIIGIGVLVGALYWARTPPVVATVSQPDPISAFRSKVYSISDTEHVTIIDVPAKWSPNRCIIYVNERTRTSHMRCELDGATDAEMPPDPLPDREY